MSIIRQFPKIQKYFAKGRRGVRAAQYLQSVQVYLICSSPSTKTKNKFLNWVTTSSATWRLDNIQKKDTHPREHNMFATGASWPHMATIPSPSSELCVQCSSVLKSHVFCTKQATGKSSPVQVDLTWPIIPTMATPFSASTYKTYKNYEKKYI